MNDELQDIKDRVRDHYSRGLSEPVGLPRSTWLDDTQWLIAEVERLRDAISDACDAMERSEL